MTYNKYKIILIGYIVFYILLWVFFKLFDTDYINISVSYLYALFLILFLTQAALLIFIINARILGVSNCNEKFTPHKLFPLILWWVILCSIFYPISMGITYKIINQPLLKDQKNIEETIKELYDASIDPAVEADKRHFYASYHYMMTGEKSYYLDENNEKRQYVPDKKTREKRKKNIDSFSKLKHFYIMQVTTSVLSISLGIFAILVYFRVRKKDKLNIAT